MIINWSRKCEGTIDTRLEQCGRDAAFFVQSEPDIDYGLYACATHLAQRVRFVHEGHDAERSVTVHVRGGAS